jgi:chromate transporter
VAGLPGRRGSRRRHDRGLARPGAAALGLITAIYGSAIPLARALTYPWQYAITAAALVLLLLLRRGVVLTLLSAAAVGVIVALTVGSALH